MSTLASEQTKRLTTLFMTKHCKLCVKDPSAWSYLSARLCPLIAEYLKDFPPANPFTLRLVWEKVEMNEDEIA